eukprot:Hpha_TRINITY_DN22875_c0_g1::TRINITY_DN22875_c0_g1_i1::g.84385::m.84385
MQDPLSPDRGQAVASPFSPTSWHGSEEEAAFLRGMVSPTPVDGSQQRAPEPSGGGVGSVAVGGEGSPGRTGVLSPPPFEAGGFPLDGFSFLPPPPPLPPGLLFPSPSYAPSPERGALLKSPPPPRSAGFSRSSCVVHIAPLPMLPSHPGSQGVVCDWVNRTLEKFGEVKGITAELTQGWARAVFSKASDAAAAVQASSKGDVKLFSGAGGLRVWFLSDLGGAGVGWHEELSPDQIPASLLSPRSVQRADPPGGDRGGSPRPKWISPYHASPPRVPVAEASTLPEGSGAVEKAPLDMLPVPTVTVTLLERQAEERAAKSPRRTRGRRGVGLDLLLAAPCRGGHWLGNPYVRLLRVLQEGQARCLPAGTAHDPHWLLQPWLASSQETVPPLPSDSVGVSHWRSKEWRGGEEAQKEGEKEDGARLVLRSGRDGMPEAPPCTPGAAVDAPREAAKAPRGRTPPPKPPAELLALSAARSAERSASQVVYQPPYFTEFVRSAAPAAAAAGKAASPPKRLRKKPLIGSRGAGTRPTVSAIERFARAALSTVQPTAGDTKEGRKGEATGRRPAVDREDDVFAAACVAAATPEPREAAQDRRRRGWEQREERPPTPRRLAPASKAARSPSPPRIAPPSSLAGEEAASAHQSPVPSPKPLANAEFLPFASRSLLDITGGKFGGRKVLIAEGQQVRLTQKVCRGLQHFPCGAEAKVIRIPGTEPGAMADVEIGQPPVCIGVVSGQLEPFDLTPREDDDPASPVGGEGAGTFEFEVNRQARKLNKRAESLFVAEGDVGFREEVRMEREQKKKKDAAEVAAMESMQELQEMTRVLAAGRLRREFVADELQAVVSEAPRPVTSLSRFSEPRAVPSESRAGSEFRSRIPPRLLSEPRPESWAGLSGSRAGLGWSEPPTQPLAAPRFSEPRVPPGLSEARAGPLDPQQHPSTDEIRIAVLTPPQGLEEAECRRRLERDEYSQWYLTQKLRSLSPPRH